MKDRLFYRVGIENGEEVIEVFQGCDWESESKGLLQTIYEDGQFFNQTTLSEIRNRLTE